MTISKQMMRRIMSRLPAWAPRMLGSNLVAACVLATLVLNCPAPEPVKYKGINVPFVRQERPEWCAAATVQMWGKYRYADFSVAQSTIANQTGWFGAVPSGIVAALQYYLTVMAEEFSYPPPGDTNLNYWQDTLMSAQASLLNGNRPSIPVIYGSRVIKHAVIWTGWKWHDSAGGPVIDFVYYNDPDLGPNIEKNVAEYKSFIFEPYIYNGLSVYSVVMERGGVSRRRLIQDAQANLNEFVSMGGRFRGGPRPYDPWGYNPYPYRAE